MEKSQGNNLEKKVRREQENTSDKTAPGKKKCRLSRRSLLSMASKGAVAGAFALTVPGCLGKGEGASFRTEEYFKKNYQLMTSKERAATIYRIERLWELEHSNRISLSGQEPLEKVKFGYAFNLSRCKGYMDCVKACVEENNLNRKNKTQYIRIFENREGNFSLSSSSGRFAHEVPAAGRFYMGVQCFHCEKPPCTKVCPTGATWKEKDGIVVVDYDWCIGCRYCAAACPYWGRRFNWAKPTIPADKINRKQHYLGNRIRPVGSMEKCTFCIQRTRKGKLPACVDSCPTGARVFGNLLDPKSEIRYILAQKKVFRLREDLHTEPNFWYFMD